MSNQPKKTQFAYRTAAGRLAYYRAYAAWHSDSPRLGATDWRAARSYLFAPYSERARHSVDRSEDGTKGFADSFDAIGWRDLGDVHDICRNSDEISSRLVDHNGWYADSDRCALIIGRVLQLPARAGVPQYVPATYCDEWDGVTLHLSDVCDNLRDAVIRADRLAEIEAEEAREENAKYQAEMQIEDLKREIAGDREAALALLREMRPIRKSGQESPAICAALRERVSGYRKAIEEARERIAELTENHWAAVEGY